MSLIERIKSLDLTTQDGLDEAKKLIGFHSRDDAIRSFHDVVEGIEQAAENERPNWIEQAEKGWDEIRSLNAFVEEKPTSMLQKAPTQDEINNYQMEFFIDNWMPANRLTLFTGPGSTGKSYMALQHICGLAMGVSDYQLKPYHGDFEKDKATITPDLFRKLPINIVIASYEEDRMETWKRLSRKGAYSWIQLKKADSCWCGALTPAYRVCEVSL